MCCLVHHSINISLQHCGVDTTRFKIQIDLPSPSILRWIRLYWFMHLYLFWNSKFLINKLCNICTVFCLLIETDVLDSVLSQVLCLILCRKNNGNAGKRSDRTDLRGRCVRNSCLSLQKSTCLRVCKCSRQMLNMKIQRLLRTILCLYTVKQPLHFKIASEIWSWNCFIL